MKQLSPGAAMSTFQEVANDKTAPHAPHVSRVSPELEPARTRVERGPRQSQQEGATSDYAEETLIIDSRSNLRPAQYVEDKLISLLKAEAVPVSHARMTTLCKG